MSSLTEAQQDRVEVLRRDLLRWYRRNRRDLPWRRTRDPYPIWVSEVMLQQTRVEAVVPYFERFLHRFPSLAALAAARTEDVLSAWSGLGYYRRARMLHAAARIVVAEHGGTFPAEPAAARALPGIGRYTAGAVLSIAFGRAEPVLDGNVARVLTRLFRLAGNPARNPLAAGLWEVARSFVAKEDPGDVNQALMELGATVCLPAAAPRCRFCPLARSCEALRAGEAARYPEIPARRALVEEHWAVALLGRRGRWLLRQRDETESLLAGLWEFPTESAASGTVSTEGNAARLRAFLRDTCGLQADRLARRGEHVQILSGRRVVHHVFEVEARGRTRGALRWVSAGAVESLPLTTATRKILRRFGSQAGPSKAAKQAPTAARRASR